MMSKKRIIHLCTVECPHCKKIVDIIQITDVTKPAVPAEKEVVFKAEKSEQTTLS